MKHSLVDGLWFGVRGLCSEKIKNHQDYFNTYDDFDAGRPEVKMLQVNGKSMNMKTVPNCRYVGREPEMENRDHVIHGGQPTLEILVANSPPYSLRGCIMGKHGTP